MLTKPDWGLGSARWKMVQAAWELMLVEEPLELTQAAVANAAGASQSLFRRYFPTWDELYGEIAAVAACLLSINIRDCENVEALVRRWYQFQELLPRQYEAIFGRAHALHPKLYTPCPSLRGQPCRTAVNATNVPR